MTEHIELTTRGKKQIRGIVCEEIKPLLDTIMRETIEKLIEKRAAVLIESMQYSVSTAIEKQVKEMYWHVMEDALKKADFQTLFRDEIIKYLHEKWTCGSVPFEQQFDKALLKTVKVLAKGDD